MTSVSAQGGRNIWAKRALPTTRLGRIACWLMLGFIVWFILNQAAVVIQNQGIMGVQRELEGAPRVALIVFGFLGFACGLAAGVVALIAVVRDHERSVLAFFSMLPGLFVLAFLLGELLVPH